MRLLVCRICLFKICKVQDLEVEKLLLNYFNGAEHQQKVLAGKIKLIYEDNTLLKRMGIPKRFFRSYYLLLKSNGTSQKTRISHKEKEIIKPIIQSLYENKKKSKGRY